VTATVLRMEGRSLPVAKKRGRPVGATGADTRERLIESARRIFAEHGFDRATMGDISRAAQIVPSAFYHHFSDKESLYEAVFEATISHLWEVLDESTRGRDTARDALDALITAADRARKQLPYYPEYLTGLPLEAARHPRFQTLVDRRIETQRVTFRHVASLGRSTGEFDDTLLLEELSENLRIIVMGWLVERNVRVEKGPLRTAGLLHLLGLTGGLEPS
jgi:AcrR family transcriptional regulator